MILPLAYKLASILAFLTGDCDYMSEAAKLENHPFQAEVQQVLNLVVHSLYSKREIFLRELVSNASDALEKLRFAALADESLYEKDSELTIRVEFNREHKTLSVVDNGIGMSAGEAREHLGTIAGSGTRKLLAKLQQGENSSPENLIGQFGVGFYSAFIVADKVEVSSRRAGAARGDGIRWCSDGSSGFSLESEDRPSRGTRVTLHLKDDAVEFLEEARLNHLIRQYSDHIQFKIYLQGEDGDQVVNQARALWTENKSEISEQQYQEFYKHIAHDHQDPLCWSHHRVEGRNEYTLLLYVPAHSTRLPWSHEPEGGVRLYVQRVFILEDKDDNFLPMWLRFVRGVIDIQDLPLNVSRELLQHNEVTAKVRGMCIRKVLQMLTSMAEKKAEDYARFWEQHGSLLKAGVTEASDSAYRQEVIELMRFASTGGEQLTSLKQYSEAMPESQQAIYYLAADNLAAARVSPLLQVYLDKGIEVLLLGEPADEWLLQNHVGTYNDKPLRAINRESFDIDQEQEQDRDNTLPGQIKQYLKDSVQDVRWSRRLRDTASCLVHGDNAMGAGMERMMRASGHEVPVTPPILELNPEHPLLRHIAKLEDEQKLEEWAQLLLEQAQLTEGMTLAAPGKFIQRLNVLLGDIIGSS